MGLRCVLINDNQSTLTLFLAAPYSSISMLKRQKMRRHRVSRSEYLRHPAQWALRGNALSGAKLTAKKVRIIRENRQGKTAKELAAALGVHYRTIEKVRYFQTWVHV